MRLLFHYGGRENEVKNAWLDRVPHWEAECIAKFEGKDYDNRTVEIKFHSCQKLDSNGGWQSYPEGVELFLPESGLYSYAQGVSSKRPRG